jgi:hypothetical protein
MTDYDLDETNYDNDEHIYSWDTDTPMIRPDIITCDNCNYRLNYEGPRCTNSTCSNCGHRVKVDGYPELKYKNEIVEIDTTFEEQANKENKVEHMSETRKSKEHMSGEDYLAYVLPMLLFLFISFAFASYRKELTPSTVLCIIVFPYAYLSYVAVDYIVFGGRCAQNSQNMRK